MAADKGFLARLTGSEVDESAQASAVRREMDPMRALGMSARTGVAGIGGAIGSLLTKGQRDYKSIYRNSLGSAQNEQDRMDAQLSGISPEELQSRRAIRKELGKAQFADDGSYSARIRMAQRAAQIANAMGDANTLGRSLQAIDEVREEQVEMSRLEAEESRAVQKELRDQKEHDLDRIHTAYHTDGSAKSGVLDMNDQNQSGLWISDGRGGAVFKPFDADFSLHDPLKNANKRRTIALAMRDLITPTQLSKFHAQAMGADAALQRTDRVVSSLWDAAKGVGADVIMGPAGKMAVAYDNFARAANSTIRLWAPGFANDKKLRESLTDPNKTMLEWVNEDGSRGAASIEGLIPLPEGVAEASAQAQQYRAAIMDMAYMAARLAEPSNRGLSDKDIEAALTRIVGTSSNPQVMIRRFLEMQLDAAHELDFHVGLYKGSLGSEYGDDEIEMYLGGQSYQRYKTAKEDLFERYGVEKVVANRVQLGGALLGTDVNPGGEVREGTAAGQTRTPQEEAEAQLGRELTVQERLDILKGVLTLPELLQKEGGQ